MQENPNH